MTKWWQKAVVYQVYPRSFQDSNGDGIGDLPGIIQRLPYIKKLGVDVIWLNPIYKTSNVDGGYDISDYQAINPDFGTMTDFKKLLAQAHQMGLKIMLDLVVNHSSSEHPWFIESRQSKDNPHRDFYIWRDPVNGHEPNNWGSFFSGPAWTYDTKTQQYYLHLFAKEQPDLNWANPQVRQAVFKMMNWWAKQGIDGFRMDVISLLSKPDGLPDGPQAPNAPYGDGGSLVANGKHEHEYLREMNQQVLSKYDWITVGETAGVTIDQAAKYANLDGNELNMVFQFEHMGLDNNRDPRLGKWSDQKATLTALRANLTKWQQKLANRAWNSLYWNNHDQPRVVSRFGNDSPQYRVLSAKMLATMLHCMQGTPYIYQGEELGMTNTHFATLDDVVDVEARNAYHELVDQEKIISGQKLLRYFDAKSRDNARTPMQWNDQKNAGFSSGKPWLQLNANYQQINAAAALADPNSIFYFYQQLIKLRHNLAVITDGDFQLVKDNDQDPAVFAYTRRNSDQQLLVICNFTDQTLERDYSLVPEAKLILQNYQGKMTTSLRPYEARVYLTD
ncbi:glycoside hydrolase family 13 protein [Liquorilactobacillus vini]|uniref:Oligo-1,6-glucosidase n=4 Tax=Lactobacillaceae TaxID=33958 RepID=A0A0R2CP73_9LACO|nr:alpha-glucosidase [Liquorilactobacillus vini]KRM89603.1 oligo-1,6-glucosidase [Liquorilactobacillus vini DSM 20605]